MPQGCDGSGTGSTAGSTAGHSGADQHEVLVRSGVVLDAAPLSVSSR
ncbi:hypothetical protein FM103_09460 [Corynebacterium xerosis]|nr:hypothetical protein FM103_09460 [Corynebacterium xerosis]